MEEEFRQDRREKDKTITALSKEIQALKVTLIGIDGQNGMRSQINGLSSDIKEIKKSFEKYFKDIEDLRHLESKNDLIFATKAELRNSEDAVIQKIQCLDDTLERDRKERENDRDAQQKYLRSLNMSKGLFLLSIVSLVSSVAMGIFL